MKTFCSDEFIGEFSSKYLKIEKKLGNQVEPVLKTSFQDFHRPFQTYDFELFYFKWCVIRSEII